MNAIRIFSIIVGAAALAACGGGSSSGGIGGDGGRATLTISASANSLLANPQGFAPSANSPYTIQVSVQFRQANGGNVPDGSVVTLSSSASSRAVVSPIDDPGSTGNTASSPTSGGFARFWVTGGPQSGPVTLTASAPNPAGGAQLSTTLQVTVEPNTGPGRLTITGSNTMPTNPQGVPIFFGSPFINELTVRYLGPNGQAGSVSDGTVAVAIAPVTRAAFSTLDDPDTPDVNEFEVLVGAGPVVMTAGVTTLFIHSFEFPGPVTVTVSAQDASTGEQFSADFVINIEDGAADFLPNQLDFSVSPSPVYATGSGGATTKPIQLIVRDSAGNPVPNPSTTGASWNNVRLQLDAPAGSGARLVGTGASGSVNGTDIAVRTVNGIANFSLNAGSAIGSHRIIATVDRADNNVDQGIADPLTAETTIEVGDGRLFALTLVSPILNSIRVNSTTTGIETSFEASVDPVTGALIPPDPDGTYSLTVTVQGTDRAGNPVLPGTVVNFGKIDSPLTPMLPRQFVFSGADGNPQEGGTLFSVLNPPVGFLDNPTAVDDAVEPGDFVTLFGKLIPGNREHEAVRVVQNVIDNSTVRVTQAFNPNNQTGSIVNDGFVIPWVIGRSQVGVIDQSVSLGQAGRGSVRLTYPINALGRPLVLWSQGTRVESTGNKTVADVEAAVFPGVAPLLLTASPSTIQANTPTPVRLCLTDGLGSPIEGRFVTGSVVEGPGSGSLDGVPMTTTTANATGSNGGGCVITTLTVSGLTPDGDESTVLFTVGDAEAEVQVVPPGAAVLLVEPSLITDVTLSVFTRVVELTLLSGNGQPISGAQLTGECEADGGIFELQVNPGVTDSNGRTTASVLVGLAGCGTDGGSYPRTGTCTFTTTSGSPEGILKGIGIDVLSLGVSPPPVGCPPEDGGSQSQLFLIVNDERPAPQPSSLVTSTPAGLACSAGGSGTCDASFQQGTTVVLVAPGGTTPVFSGGCQQQTGSPANFGQVSLTTATQTCVVTFN